MIYPFRIRRASPEDREPITAICRAFDPEDWVPEALDWLVGEQEPKGLYVAEQEGRVIGLYHLDSPAPGEAYFSAMRIDPAMQGQGLGSLFCRAQVEQARSLGLSTTYLLSLLDNLPAHRTVQKNGFANLGAWYVRGELPAVSFAPDLDRARPATPDDMAEVRAFLARLDQDPLEQVIASRSHPYMVCSVRACDWVPENIVVVMGPEGLEGLMLLAVTSDDVIIRALEGRQETAAHLLAYASSQRGEGRSWSLSLPARCEPLLAPLGLDPREAFRAYVFRNVTL